ncbi:MAG: glutathione S-transferase family protein [Hyphomonas sp.]|nr:glutathione S-transferase family protein [Hyphomonas sp.]
MYTIYGSEQSFFTRKLEAAFLFYGMPHRLVRKRGAENEEEIKLRSGTHQVPVLHTPENWMIADTTPILSLLDGRQGRTNLFPQGLAGLLVHVVEECLDEWISRVMVHYRWTYPENAEFASLQISGGREDIAEAVRKWGPKACRATGTGSPELGREAEVEYEQLLDAADTQLAQSEFLMGGQPTAVDCAILGGLRAHILNDPAQQEMARKYERLMAWEAATRSGWSGKGAGISFAQPTRFAQEVLSAPWAEYARVVMGNRQALLAGEKAFGLKTYGHAASYLTRPYPEKSRQMIVDRIQSLLPDEHVPAARSWLSEVGLDQVFEE